MDVSRIVLAVTLALASAACERAGPANSNAAASSGNTNAADAVAAESEKSNSVAPAPAPEPAPAPAATPGEIRGVFRSFERGDHLYAMFDLPAGREAESTALIRDVELAAFLNAHKGEPLNLVIQTRNEHLDPPGEDMDVTSLVGARSDTRTSQQWWQSLSPEQQTAARTEIEDLPPAGGG